MTKYTTPIDQCQTGEEIRQRLADLHKAVQRPDHHDMLVRIATIIREFDASASPDTIQQVLTNINTIVCLDAAIIHESRMRTSALIDFETE